MEGGTGFRPQLQPWVLAVVQVLGSGWLLSAWELSVPKQTWSGELTLCWFWGSAFCMVTSVFSFSKWAILAPSAHTGQLLNIASIDLLAIQLVKLFISIFLILFLSHLCFQKR